MSVRISLIKFLETSLTRGRSNGFLAAAIIQTGFLKAFIGFIYQTSTKQITSHLLILEPAFTQRLAISMDSAEHILLPKLRLLIVFVKNYLVAANQIARPIVIVQIIHSFFPLV